MSHESQRPPTLTHKRKSIQQILAECNVDLDQMTVACLEASMNAEWWRGYNAAIKCFTDKSTTKTNK